MEFDRAPAVTLSWGASGLLVIFVSSRSPRGSENCVQSGNCFLVFSAPGWKNLFQGPWVSDCRSLLPFSLTWQVEGFRGH